MTLPNAYSYPWRMVAQFEDPNDVYDFAISGGWSDMKDLLESTGLTEDMIAGAWAVIDSYCYYLPPEFETFEGTVLEIIHGRAFIKTVTLYRTDIGVLVAAGLLEDSL